VPPPSRAVGHGVSPPLNQAPGLEVRAPFPLYNRAAQGNFTRSNSKLPTLKRERFYEEGQMPVAVGIDLHPASTYYTFKPILYVIA